jgi:hypothetical protein
VVNFEAFADIVEMSPRVDVRRAMAQPNLELQIARSPVLRYGLAVLSVSVALGASLLVERFQFRNVADPLFLFAIAIAVWYAGIGPAILAVVLSGLADTLPWGIQDALRRQPCSDAPGSETTEGRWVGGVKAN